MQHRIEHNGTLLFNYVGKLPQHGVSSQISLSAFGFWSCTVSSSFQEVMLTVCEHVYYMSVCVPLRLLPVLVSVFFKNEHQDLFFSRAGSH